MLVVYSGNDSIAVREAAFSHVAKAETDGAEVHRVEADEFAPGIVANALGASSLFGGTELFVFDTPSSNSDFNEAIKESLKEMGESHNTFIVIEGALLAPQKKLYQKHASLFEEMKAEARERFNVFTMADALARKDKKTLWLLFAQAKRHGLSDEEIIGTLWWQLKTLWLAKNTTSANEAGVKDFPYQKAKRSLSKFSEGEIESLSYSLLRVYHEGHAGMKDISLSLEKWILAL